MTEKYGLPFEIVESKDTIDKDKNKIKAATLYDSHGYGQSKQKIRSGKAGGQTATISSSRKTIVTIAESDLLEELVKKLKHLNDNSEKKIGVISIQPVDTLVHL